MDKSIAKQIKKGVGLAIVGVLFTMFGLSEEPIDETLSLVKLVLKDEETEEVPKRYRTVNIAK